MGQRTRMQRPTATITEQHEIARIKSVLDRDLFDGACHDYGRDRQYALRDVDKTTGSSVTERFGDTLHGRARRISVERELAAEEAIGVEPAEHQIGIGYGRLAAAMSVASRTRCRAGALRTDMKADLRVEPRN